MSGVAWATVVIFVGAYVLIATEKVHRVAAALGGAVLMLLIGATSAHQAFFSHETGIDWYVIFLLLGMMLIVSVLARTGVFEYVAIWAAKRGRGHPFAILVILVQVTAVASAVLDNVTTVLLIAPVTLLVCERLEVPAVPFLISEALAANIGGTATLVGDPPNIVIASRGGLSYNDFLVNLAPFTAILLVVFAGLCRILFRDSLRYDRQRAKAIMALREREAIRDVRLLITGLIVLAAVTAGFVLHSVIGLEPAVVALTGGLVLLAASRLNAEDVARDVEWSTLIFFAGLFVMAGALVETGVIRKVSAAFTHTAEGNLLAASLLLLVISAALSAIVDNIPYVATISPIVAQIVQVNGNDHRSVVLWWALALGAGLGGNATAVGASANVVILGLAGRAGHRISFWEFTKYGLVVTAVTIGLAVPYLWLRYFAFA